MQYFLIGLSRKSTHMIITQTRAACAVKESVGNGFENVILRLILAVPLKSQSYDFNVIAQIGL